MSAVPDDLVPSIEVGDVRLGIYGHGDVNAVTLRFLGALPLKVGERVEVEIVSIERTVVER